MTTQQEQDKEVAALYLARSEGKIIEILNGLGHWCEKPPHSRINYGSRVKPQTVEEAAKLRADLYGLAGSNRQQCINDFKAGARCQKEQDNEN